MRFTKRKVICLLLVLILLSVTVQGCRLSEANRTRTFEVSVFLPDKAQNPDDKKAKGLMRAAEDNRLKLNFIPLSDTDSIRALVEREARYGVEGLIIGSGAAGVVKAVQQAAPNVPTVWMGSANGVRFDNGAMGRDLAAALQNADPGLQKVLLPANTLSAEEQQRLDAAAGFFAEQGVETQRTDAGFLTQQGLELPPHTGIAYVQQSLLLAQTQTLAAFPNITAAGIGSSAEALTLLKNGRIQRLVFPNEFEMGYRTAQMLADRIAGRRADTQTAGYLVLDETALYDPACESLLYDQGD